MERKQKIQSLLNRLKILQASRASTSVSETVEKLLSEETVATTTAIGGSGNAIRRLAKEVESIQKDPRVKKLTSKVRRVQSVNDTRLSELEASFSEKIGELLKDIRTVESTGKALTESKIPPLLARFEEMRAEYQAAATELTSKNALLDTELKTLSAELSKVPGMFEQDFLDLATEISQTNSTVAATGARAEEIAKAIDEAEKRLEGRIAAIQQRGGGNANRSIIVNGDKDTLKYFTDINLKPGSNVTLTYAKNVATGYTDITISSSGGGGGNSRSVNNIAVDTAAGSSAGTDYVYIASSPLTVTLPATVGNTNLYTIKNTSNGQVTIVGTGGDTIDGDANIILDVKYTSVDLISDGVNNWNIT